MNTKIATILATALLASTAALTVSDTAHAVVPGAVTHQGRLFDDMGDPVSDTLDVTFAIYDTANGGSELWSETISVDFVDGYYSARLGETNALGAILDGTDKYMGVSIDGDERVIDETGSWVGCELHFYYEVWKDNGENDDIIPDHFRDVWPDYLERVRNMRLPENARFREIHDGHLVYLQPEERRFVTPAAIENGCLVGEPDAIIEHVRRLEASGIREIALWPPMDCERKVLEDFARHVMPAFR